MNDMKNVPVRCENNDPRRCQKNTAHGQCPFLSQPGANYCAIHGPIIDQNAQGLYQFNRTEVIHRINAFRSHGDSRTLAIELGLLRLLLEQLVNKCDAYDLLMHSVQLTTLITQIKELQISNVKLEQKVGDLLSSEQVIDIAQSLYAVVSSTLLSNSNSNSNYPPIPHAPELLAEIATKFEDILTPGLPRGGS